MRATTSVRSSKMPIQTSILSRGSTGASIPNNLMKEMAMNAVRTNPNIGTVIMENMADSRWRDWSKMENKTKSINGENAVIHYVGKWENGKLIFVDDFKFKRK